MCIWSMFFLPAIIFFIFYVFRHYFFQIREAETASAASVMAFGIFINGALNKFPTFQFLGEIFVYFLIFIWFTVILSYFKSALKKELVIKHFYNSSQTFLIGTWVAATAVTGTAIVLWLPQLIELSIIMGIIALMLWLFYIKKVLKSLKRVWSKRDFQNIHGSILLPTVSTQSLVVIFSTVFGDQISKDVYLIFIVTGILFYVTGILYIFKRYMNLKTFDVTVDWPNTNCIIHGAMSITGLASVCSNALSPNLIMLIWFWVLGWFVIVESIELYRAKVRIQKMGCKKGIGTYPVSQWSRNFTFGMMYAFTLNYDISQVTWLNPDLLITIKTYIIDYSSWIILIALLYESILFIMEKSLIRFSSIFKFFSKKMIGFNR